MFANISIAEFDPEIAQAIASEGERQEAHIELIASENYCSPAVMEAQGSKLTNKYAEGYPGKRYYGGCEYVDVVEQLAIDRAKALFGADYANVQPHAGSQANSAVYLALLNPGDTVLGMSLAHGGHLTHGAKVSFSGKTYNAIQYGLNPETGEIPDEIDASALDSWIYNTDTADKILDTLMQYGIRIENGEKLGKTIIFAKKHDHAEFIRKRFNANYPHYKDQFLKVIDYQAEYKHDLLSDFKLPNKMPQIACSVDMLDTGIDVPEVVNLVFLRPVKSNVKFWQMIGRGTRLCKNLFGYQLFWAGCVVVECLSKP